VPPGLELRARAASGPAAVAANVPTWAERVALDLPIVIGRSAIQRADLGRLAVRTVVTIEGVPSLRVTRLGAPTVQAAELEILGGVVGLRGKPGAVAAEVVTGYVPRAMSLPDDAHVELTVGLGTTRMSLRQVFELAVGQVVGLGRPLAGPFDVRAAGKLVGKGELVDVDGELAVRIVSLGDQE
jgi:flagellar motor switch/type III secretory pathway protein FliN